jgi:hypothetical protein
VSDHHQRQAFLAAQILQKIEDLAAGLRIQIPRRLVGQKARATATRCDSPADSSEMRWSRRWFSRTRSSSSATRRWRCRSLRSTPNMAISTFSAAVSPVIRWKD